MEALTNLVHYVRNSLTFENRSNLAGHLSALVAKQLTGSLLILGCLFSPQVPAAIPQATPPASQQADKAGEENKTQPAINNVANPAKKHTETPNTQHSIYNLRNLVVAQSGERNGQPGIVFQLEEFEMAKQKVEAMTTKMETRTRTIVMDRGQGAEEVEQTYQVAVPVQVQREVSRPKSTGMKRKFVALEDLKMYDLNGKELTGDRLKKRLAAVKSAFLVRRSIGTIPAASQALRSAVNPEACFVVATEALPITAAELAHLATQNVAVPANANIAVPARAVAQIANANQDAAVAPAALPAPVFNVAPAEVRAIRAVPLQPAIAARGRVNRNTLSSRTYDPANLILAKIDSAGNGPKLVCIVDQFRTEERETWVTRTRTEKRTRKMKVIVDGEEKEIEREYEVRVPLREKAMTPVRVPAGRKPVSVDWEDVKLYRLDGEQVTLEEATEILSAARPVYRVQGNLNVDIEAASSLLQQASSEHTLVLVTQKPEIFGR